MEKIDGQMMWPHMGATGRVQFLRFAEGLFAAVAQAAVTPAGYAPVIPHGLTYTPGPTRAAADPPLLTVGPGRELRPMIIAGGLDRSPNLARMVARVAAGFDRPVEAVDLAAVDIKSGSPGCPYCGLGNVRPAHCGKFGHTFQARGGGGAGCQDLQLERLPYVNTFLRKE
jgi:hypothetical protein